jgi:hypothetical protein
VIYKWKHCNKRLIIIDFCKKWIYMKNTKYLPFILMLIGCFHYGSTTPVRSSTLTFTIIITLGYYYTQKPSNFQKEVKIGILLLAAFMGITKFFKSFKMLDRLNWDIGIEYLFTAAGCGIFIASNISFIKELLVNVKKNKQ